MTVVTERDAGSSGAVPSYQDYLAHDSREVPRSLLERSWRDLGNAPLDASRYTSQAFFDLEVERMWTRVWQMACREEELPEAGDTIVYDVVGRSLLITRQADGSIRAFHNSCTHRGRKLLLADEHVEHFRCPFHGISWQLDGSVRSIPCRWDFEHVSDGDFCLPEARVGTWGGFVFVNFDAGAIPLEQYLEVVPDHFSRWRLEDCWKAVHVAKVIRCNWKVAQEAFMESYHVIATHPQILSIIADANSQYDVYGQHVSRNLAAFGAPSPHLGSGKVDPQQTLDGMLQLMGRKPGALGAVTAQEARGPRALLGDLNRRAFRPGLRRRLQQRDRRRNARRDRLQRVSELLALGRVRAEHRLPLAPAWARRRIVRHGSHDPEAAGARTAAAEAGARALAARR